MILLINIYIKSLLLMKICKLIIILNEWKKLKIKLI